jgi:hypothetical protein
MATFKSVEVTAKDASVGEKYDARTSAGHIKTAEFTYNTVGTEAAADVIELVELPAGAKIVGYAFTNEDFGTSTGDLGTTSGGQELAAALALGTAGNVSDFFAPIDGNSATVYLEILTATADADKDFNGVIYYFVDAV